MTTPYRPPSDKPSLGTYAAATGIAAALALGVRMAARRAERRNPPTGKFIDVGGTRLHYIERGQGQALVLLHGRGLMLRDLELSGLLDLAAQRYRVIAFDRPGYGHSALPRDREWHPLAQARLLREALRQLDVERPIVVAHSWAAMIAIGMALEFPDRVRALVLLGGYYYPVWRAETPANVLATLPGIGQAMRYTIWPLLGYALWPLASKRLFAPARVTKRFAQFPADMALRPTQLLATSAEGALAPAAAAQLHERYRDLTLPVVLVAGEADRYIDTARHSVRLHAALPNSELFFVAGAGHMLHHLAPENVLAAVEAAERRAVLQPGAADAERGTAAPAARVTNEEAGKYWTGP